MAEEFEKEHAYTEEDKTTEERTQDIKKGEAAENVYSEEGREELIDNDEIAPWEEAFMEGAEGRGGQTSCRYCGKLLGQDKSKIVERKIGTNDLWFCCDHCAEEYMKKRGKKLLE